MIELTPLAPEHFPLAAGWLSDPAINRWLSGDWRSKATSVTMIAIAVRNRRNMFFLVSIDGRPCGLVALSEIESSDKLAMIWYLLREPQFAAKGIMSEAVKQLTRHAFETLQLESVYAWAMQSNAASIRVLEKSGFQSAGRLRRSANLSGQQIDRLYFDLTRLDVTR